MSLLAVDTRRASTVFDMLQVQGPDGETYLPNSLLAEAVREMGYYPTVELLQETLEEISPEGRTSLTYAQFARLCDRLKPTRQFDATAIAQHVKPFDVHGDGILSRAEFRAILTTAAAARPTVSEVEAIVELLDPLHTDAIQLRTLQVVMSRFLSSSRRHSTSPYYTPRSRQCEPDNEIPADRHLMPRSLYVEAADSQRFSQGKRGGRPSAENRQPRRTLPLAVTAPEDVSSGGEPSPGMPAPKTTAPSPYTSGNQTRATSLQQVELQRHDPEKKENQQHHGDQHNEKEEQTQVEEQQDEEEQQGQQGVRYSVRKDSAANRCEPFAMEPVADSVNSRPRLLPPPPPVDDEENSYVSPIASRITHDPAPSQTRQSGIPLSTEASNKHLTRRVQSPYSDQTMEPSLIEIDIPESRVRAASGVDNMLALPEVPMEELQDISLDDSRAANSIRSGNESPPIDAHPERSGSVRQYIPSSGMKKKKRKKILQNCCRLM